MPDPSRIRPILAELERVWELNSDMRLMQLLYFVLDAHGPLYVNLYYMDDDEVLACLQAFKPGWRVDPLREEP